MSTFPCFPLSRGIPFFQNQTPLLSMLISASASTLNRGDLVCGRLLGAGDKSVVLYGDRGSGKGWPECRKTGWAVIGLIISINCMICPDT
ncbi:hypothetical protein BaRGS_00016893 [Batillaria attramentaria]|uniref:Uncharacterized protein n=1 Tax=Batillaria attramentaria TaxID=370345 RepID=A0ABD0KYI8_9CAEN